MVVQNDTKITQPHSLTRNSENANLSLKGTLSILCKEGTSAGRGGGWQGLTLPHHHRHAGQDRASLFGEAKNGKKWWQLKIHTGSSSWSRGVPTVQATQGGVDPRDRFLPLSPPPEWCLDASNPTALANATSGLCRRQGRTMPVSLWTALARHHWGDAATNGSKACNLPLKISYFKDSWW